MSDDQPQDTASPTEVAQAPETPVSEPSSPTMGSNDTETSPEAPQGPEDVSTPIPVSNTAPESSAPLPQNQPVPIVEVSRPDPRSFLAKALASIQFRKKAKLAKVLNFALEKKSITNDQVEKILHVSDATAGRYLEQLVKNGSLRKIGPNGRARYEPVSGSNGGN